jgi:hypothetical protein
MAKPFPDAAFNLSARLYSGIPHSSSAFCIGVNFRIPHSSRLSPLFHSKAPGLRDGLWGEGATSFPTATPSPFVDQLTTANCAGISTLIFGSGTSASLSTSSSVSAK